MAFLRPNTSNDPEPFARGDGVVLRPLTMSDYSDWAELRAKSRSHLVPWEPSWASDELSRAAFRRRLRHYQREQREDIGYALGVWREPDDVLVGGVTLSNVRRGVTQSASVGYWLGLDYTGQGFMTRAVRAMFGYAFDGLRLHRLEAASMPTNATSIAVLERTGFRREGFARKYLMINGQWQDHILFARLCEDPGWGEART